VPLDWKPLSAAPVKKFLPLLRKAAEAAPDRSDIKAQPARALIEARETSEAIDLLKHHLSDPDAAPQLLFCLGQAAVAAGDDPLALKALRSAATKGADDAVDVLASTLRRLGREDEAIETAIEALNRRPRNTEPLRFLATALCARGELERLWCLCLDLRARGAHGGWLAAVMASLAAMLGRDDELGRYMDRSRWFLATRLAVSDDFNRSLAREILADKDARPMKEGALHGTGARIDHLQRSSNPHTRELLDRIRATIDGYVAEREVFADDPMMAGRPAAVSIKSWSLAVYDDGHASWHVHPGGWLSGVYYAEVPTFESAGAGHPGAIEFGPLPFGPHPDALAAHRWRVMPTPGLVVVFPSHYAHRTRPTGVKALRISIPFDVMPADAAARRH